jgi:hypothetical protein
VARRSTKSKPADPAGQADPDPNAERVAVTLKIVFDSTIRRFGFYDTVNESLSDVVYEYPSVHEATDAALVYADETWGDGQRLDPNIDLTIEGGDWDGHIPANTTIIEGPAFRNCISGHLYELDEDELRRQIVDDIRGSKSAHNDMAMRHDLPIGQAVEAAMRLYKKLYHDRKRGSNAPTQGQFLDSIFDGIERRTRERNLKAFLIVASPEWPAMDSGYTGSKVGLERIFAAAEQFSGKSPKATRTPLKTRYQTLRDAVLARDYGNAEQAIGQFDREDEDAQPQGRT